jgi:hypothetical protein
MPHERGALSSAVDYILPCVVIQMRKRLPAGLQSRKPGIVQSQPRAACETVSEELSRFLTGNTHAPTIPTGFWFPTLGLTVRPATPLAF